MKKEKLQTEFDVNVFINCPFDTQYNPLFLAIVFTVTLLGFRPRCSQEINKDERLKKIIEIMANCKYGIHDICRIERTRIKDKHLPRFNMPFELGIDIGLQASGDPKLKEKHLLILEADDHRYEMFISDLKGRDVESHKGRVGEAISKVRNWLNEAEKRDRPLPNAKLVFDEYRKFRRRLPDMAEEYDLISDDNMSFRDFCYVAAKYTEERNAKLGTS